jgi:hypothetical protein
MILWNRHHGADSAVVPFELVFSKLVREISVSCDHALFRSDLAFNVPV